MTIKKKSKPLIGFIGQGYIGKNYADDFERRGYKVVRYSLEEPYKHNGYKIQKCDIVFIAVPTPTTPKGFNDSIVREAINLVGIRKIAVIKSTVLPGSTKKFQKAFPNRFILHSPEFLAEKTAAYDAAHPNRNIIGIPEKTSAIKNRASIVLSILPKAPYKLVADSNETELIKYAGNVFLFFKILYANLFHDLAEKVGVNYDVIRNAVAADPRIGSSHLSAVNTSGHNGAIPGRGAGGHCFIKDFVALRNLYENQVGDTLGIEVFRTIEKKNIALLKESGKDIDLLKGVYGPHIA